MAFSVTWSDEFKLLFKLASGQRECGVGRVSDKYDDICERRQIDLAST